MNLLKIAGGAISSLNPNKKITLIRRYSVVDSGVVSYEDTELEALAQIQPVSSNVIAKDTFLQGVEVRRFLISGKKADIVNFFESATKSNTLIKYNDKIWTCYEIKNWSGNGWIRITGYLNESVSSDV